MEKIVSVNSAEYEIIKLLGKGKGGCSYLAERGGKFVVLKQIHHEPCVKNAGIRIPEMLDIDVENERIVKEYIDGDTIFDMVSRGESVDRYLGQVREMAAQAKAAGLNIDYFPTNFVVQNGLIYYIDYECNGYMDEWSFENWGIKYWSQTGEFLEYIRNKG